MEKYESIKDIVYAVRLLDPQTSCYLVLEHLFRNTLEIVLQYKDESLDNSTLYKKLLRIYNKELEECVNSSSAKELEILFSKTKDLFLTLMSSVAFEYDLSPEEWSTPPVDRYN